MPTVRNEGFPTRRGTAMLRGAEMRVAVCGVDAEETHRLCLRMKTYAAELRRDAEVKPFLSEEELWREFEPGRFHGAVVGYGDTKGFLCARRVREADNGCRVILVDDTDRYAIRALRIHLTDYLVRPVEDGRFRVAMDRLFND